MVSVIKRNLQFIGIQIYDSPLSNDIIYKKKMKRTFEKCIHFEILNSF